MYIFTIFKLKKLRIETYKNLRYLFISLFLSILIIGYSFIYYFFKHFYILLAMASVLVRRKYSENSIVAKNNNKIIIKYLVD